MICEPPYGANTRVCTRWREDLKESDIVAPAMSIRCQTLSDHIFIQSQIHKYKYTITQDLKETDIVAPAMSITCQTLSDQDQTLIIHSSNHKYTNTNIQMHVWKLHCQLYVKLCQNKSNSKDTITKRNNPILLFPSINMKSISNFSAQVWMLPKISAELWSESTLVPWEQICPTNSVKPVKFFTFI